MIRRTFLIGSAMGAVGLAGVALQPAPIEPTVPRGTLAARIPDTIGTYRTSGAEGLVVPAETPLTRQVYSDVLTRIYSDADGGMVMMLAAAGAATGAGLGVHRPEQCYPAAGFQIAGATQCALPSPAPAGSEARLVTAVRGDRRELVYFWVRVGHAFPVSAFDQRMALIAANLQGIVPAARLMRLSTLSDNPAGDTDAFARLEAFGRDLLRSLAPSGRQLLLGQ